MEIPTRDYSHGAQQAVDELRARGFENEKGRLPGISREEFDAIQAAQNELFDRVPVPHGTDSIRLDHDLHSAGPAHTPDVDLGRHGDESVHGNGPPRKWEGPRRHPAAPCHSDWPRSTISVTSLCRSRGPTTANNHKWVSKLEDQIVVKARIVILDMCKANQAAIGDVKSIAEQHGWSDRAVWYP